MRKLALLLALFLFSASLLAVDPDKIGESVYIMYAQEESGGMQMRCSATAFERKGNLTRFISAAHCVVTESGSSFSGGSKQTVTKIPIFLSDDKATGEKSFVRAKIDTVGRTDEGYDFCILSAEINHEVTLTPLGDERKEKNGANVINIAAPGGLGKVYFNGHVALLRIDRPLIDEASHINWEGFMLVQLPAAGGSSGSSIVSADSGKIIGLVIGAARNFTLAIPISRILNPEDKFLLRKDGKDFSPLDQLKVMTGKADSGP